MAVDLVAVLKPFSAERTGEIGGVGDVVFLAQFREKFPTDWNRIGRKKPSVQDSVCFEIDCSVQPVLLVVDPDRFLIDSDSIRTYTASWL